MEFMPQFAPLVVLTFLGAIFGLGVLGLAVLYGLLSGRRVIAKYALMVAAAGVSLYAVLLFVASLASREKILAAGEQKYFCEIDCHVAYSVVDVTPSKTFGPAPVQKAAVGTFYVVKVKTWFDERTISPRRPKDAPLTPNPRKAMVVDDRGHEFPAVTQSGTPLTQALRPGDSYTTQLVFDLPDDVRNPRLLITDASPETHFLIGHELSPLHKKIYFALGATQKPAANLFLER